MSGGSTGTGGSASSGQQQPYALPSGSVPGGQMPSQANIPQWLKGLQAGQQLAQVGMQAAGAGQPQPSPMAPRPMGGAVMGAGQPQGLMGGAVPQNAVPGSAGMQSPMMNPQMLAMLQRARGM